MGSCYSDDHIAGDNIYTDITTSITEEPQQKYRLGTVSFFFVFFFFFGGGGLKHVLLDPNPRPLCLQWFETFGTQEGFLTYQ